jgi:hypothetical protein
VNKEIISEWLKRNEFLKNLKTRAKIFILTPEDTKRFNALYIASLPLSFRVEIYAPFGQTIAGISSDGKNIYALNVNENLCFRSPLDEKNLIKFLPFNISPGLLVDFLITRIPYFEEQNITINSMENGRLEVSVQKENGEEILFDSNNQFVVSGEVDDLSFNFEKFFNFDGTPVPSRIALKHNNHELIIDIENPIINSEIETSDFVLDFPEDCVFTEVGIFQ